MLLDRRGPLAPPVDRQAKGCETEAIAFQSTMELMETLIRTFESVAGARTHGVLDRWSCAPCLWHAARERDVLITTGCQSTRWLRSGDETTPQGWRWQKLSDSLASLTEPDVVQTSWPRGGKPVDVPVVTTSGRTLSRCQGVIVCHSLSAPLSQARSWASSDVQAPVETLLAHLSARWEMEGLFGDGKEARGLDHSQRMSAQAQVALVDAGDAGLRHAARKSTIACTSPGNARSP